MTTTATTTRTQALAQEINRQMATLPATRLGRELEEALTAAQQELTAGASEQQLLELVDDYRAMAAADPDTRAGDWLNDQLIRLVDILDPE